MTKTEEILRWFNSLKVGTKFYCHTYILTKKDSMYYSYNDGYSNHSFPILLLANNCVTHNNTLSLVPPKFIYPHVEDECQSQL